MCCVRACISGSFVGGLGGKEITFDEFAYMLDTTLNSDAAAQSGSELLYTEAEWNQMRQTLAAAGKEVPDENVVSIRS